MSAEDRGTTEVWVVLLIPLSCSMQVHAGSFTCKTYLSLTALKWEKSMNFHSKLNLLFWDAMTKPDTALNVSGTWHGPFHSKCLVLYSEVLNLLSEVKKINHTELLPGIHPGCNNVFKIPPIWEVSVPFHSLDCLGLPLINNPDRAHPSRTLLFMLGWLPPSRQSHCGNSAQSSLMCSGLPVTRLKDTQPVQTPE